MPWYVSISEWNYSEKFPTREASGQVVKDKIHVAASRFWITVQIFGGLRGFVPRTECFSALSAYLCDLCVNLALRNI